MLSTQNFTYDASTRAFSAEVSELPKFNQAGFTMVSSRTGLGVVFIATEVKFDSEGDLLYWVFRSTDGRFTATVFND